MLFSVPAVASAAPLPMRSPPSQLSSMNWTTEEYGQELSSCDRIVAEL
jgi:hypothetical protein